MAGYRCPDSSDAACAAAGSRTRAATATGAAGPSLLSYTKSGETTGPPHLLAARSSLPKAFKAVKKNESRRLLCSGPAAGERGQCAARREACLSRSPPPAPPRIRPAALTLAPCRRGRRRRLASDPGGQAPCAPAWQRCRHPAAPTACQIIKLAFYPAGAESSRASGVPGTGRCADGSLAAPICALLSSALSHLGNTHPPSVQGDSQRNAHRRQSICDRLSLLGPSRPSVRLSIARR